MQTSYGMCTSESVTHLAEEIETARKEPPNAMITHAFIGFILVFLFCIQDLDAAINTPTDYTLSEIFNQVLNGPSRAIGLNAMILDCQVCGNVPLLMSFARSVYAFAWDGAFPSKVNEWLTSVSPTFNVPFIL